MSQQQYPQDPSRPAQPGTAPPTPAPPPPPPPQAQSQEAPAPAAEAQVPGTGAGPQRPEEPLWDDTRADEFRQRWYDIQTHFVEDPQASVAEARQVVGDAVRCLADSVHEREEQLARSGARASDSTEGMRDTVMQYHRLLEQVLSV